MNLQTSNRLSNRSYGPCSRILIPFTIAFLMILLPLLLLIHNLAVHNLLMENFSNIKDSSTLSNVIGYFLTQNELNRSFFSEQAIIHMADVKSLVINAELLFIVLVVLFLIMVILCAYKKKSIDLRSIDSALGIFLILLIVMMVFFTFSFNLFHEIFFTNDLWLFPMHDTIVSLYTACFFKWFTIIWIAHYAFGCFVFYLLSRVNMTEQDKAF